jgi:hypothetical protein
MPDRFLSDAELARLRSWPDEIADEDVLGLLAAHGGWEGRCSTTETSPRKRNR